MPRVVTLHTLVQNAFVTVHRLMCLRVLPACRRWGLHTGRLQVTVRPGGCLWPHPTAGPSDSPLCPKPAQVHTSTHTRIHAHVGIPAACQLLYHIYLTQSHLRLIKPEMTRLNTQSFVQLHTFNQTELYSDGVKAVGDFAPATTDDFICLIE